MMGLLKMSDRVDLRLNRAAMDELLRGRTGPVVLHKANVGRQVAGAARRRVGRKSGKLAATIDSKLVRGPKGWDVEVTAGGPSAPYAMFHHEGTRPHVITGNPLLVFEVGGVTIFARSVNHPGTKANHFLSDAAREVGLPLRRTFG